MKGLSGMKSKYRKAMTMLQKRYDRPNLLYQAHVHTIVGVPLLEEGNIKELCRLHDVVSQHLWVLKVMDCEPGPFVTSLIQLKLDEGTAFEWQWCI